MNQTQVGKENYVLKEIQCFLFPIIMIVLYEVFAISMYKYTAREEPNLFHYFILASPLTLLIASVLSDKYSRKLMLVFALAVATIVWLLIQLSYVKAAILISPLFFSTPICRAALIDNHQKFSVKNLMCLAYIALFIPWSFFSEISLYGNKTLTLSLLAAAIISAFLFQDRRDQSEKRARFFHYFSPRKRIMFLALGLLCAQLIFFLIIEKIESDKIDLKTFDLLSFGSLVGAILCFLSHDKHESLVTTSYIFLILFAFGAYLIFFYWGGVAWSAALAQVAILGGFYLPLVTERAAVILGREQRGLACGLLEFIISSSSVLALAVNGLIKYNAYFINLVLGLAVLAYLFQRVHEKRVQGAHHEQ